MRSITTWVTAVVSGSTSGTAAFAAPVWVSMRRPGH
jgi:hypothetical protein